MNHNPAINPKRTSLPAPAFGANMRDRPDTVATIVAIAFTRDLARRDLKSAADARYEINQLLEDLTP